MHLCPPPCPLTPQKCLRFCRWKIEILGNRKRELGTGKNWKEEETGQPATAAAATGHLESHPKSEKKMPIPNGIPNPNPKHIVHICTNVYMYVCMYVACWLAPWRELCSPISPQWHVLCVCVWYVTYVSHRMCVCNGK